MPDLAGILARLSAEAAAQAGNRNSNVRVERIVTSPLPHRSVRAVFPHTVPPITVSLIDKCDIASHLPLSLDLKPLPHSGYS